MNGGEREKKKSEKATPEEESATVDSERAKTPRNKRQILFSFVFFLSPLSPSLLSQGKEEIKLQYCSLSSSLWFSLSFSLSASALN